MPKRIGEAVCAVIVVAVIFLTVNGIINSIPVYSPKAAESVSIGGVSKPEISKNKIRILCFNTSHGALGCESDSEKEGGSGRRADTDTILKNARGISEIVNLSSADAVLLQDVDIDSYRSRYVNQLSYYSGNGSFSYSFANTLKCRSTCFLPPYKKADAGILTLTKCTLSSAERISLPFSEKKAASEKNCMLVCTAPIKGSEKSLVLINFEIGSGLSDSQKKAQTKAVVDYAKKRCKNGDYVIAGGSFSRFFDDTALRYPLSQSNVKNPESMNTSDTASELMLCYDAAVPTARILSSPYDASDEACQVYISDGFLVSKNLTVSMVATVDQQFRYSSHNPVMLEIIFK